MSKNYMKKSFIPAAYILILLALYIRAPDYIGDNQNARFNLTQSIVEDGVFNIDKRVENTIDWARHGDYYYAAKAPGISFLGVPFYWIMLKIEKTFGLVRPYQDQFRMRVVDVFLTAIPSVLSSLLLWVYLRRKKHAYPGIITFAYSMATLMLPFSTTLWGHPTAAAFLFFAFYLITIKARMEWVGLFFGIAVLIDFITAPIAVGLFAYALTVWKKPIQSTRRFILGGLPPLLLLLFYNWKCFGSPFAVAYSFSNPVFNVTDENKLFGFLSLPIPDALWGLTFGFRSGLFVLFPVTLFALIGLFNGLRSRNSKTESMIALYIVIVIYLGNASFPYWDGGYSSGPRHLIPMLPFLILGLQWIKFNFLFYIALLYSAVNAAAILSVTLFAPQPQNMMYGFIWPQMFLHDWFFQYFIPIFLTSIVLFLLAYMGSEQRAVASK